jgi:hypothetical protein
VMLRRRLMHEVVLGAFGAMPPACILNNTTSTQLVLF